MRNIIIVEPGSTGYNFVEDIVPLNSLLLLMIVLGKNRLTALFSQGVYEGFILKEEAAWGISCSTPQA